MIRYNMYGWALGISGCGLFVEYSFETEEELEVFLKDNENIKFNDEAWEMLSVEYKEKFKKHKQEVKQ